MMHKPSVVATTLAHVFKDFDLDVIAIDRHLLQYIPSEFRGKGEDLLHFLANLIIMEKVQICLDKVYGVIAGFHKGITILYAVKKDVLAKGVVVKKGSTCLNDVTSLVRKKLLAMLPRVPLMIIDLSLWELHHEKEKRSLIKQLVVAINEIRSWLTDLNLVFVSTPIHVVQELQNIVLNKVTYFITGVFYKLLPVDKTVILDPYASEELTEYDVGKYDYFVIGGVVDRLYPRPYATYTIYRLHKLCFSRKAIKLNGSTIGVPNELNKVINIILNVKFNHTSIAEAIKMNMSTRDKFTRVLHEVEKILRTKGKIDEDYVDRVMKEYGLDERYKHKVMSFVKRFRVV